MTADFMIEELKLQLPPTPAAYGVYKPVLIHDNHVYLSGHGPFNSDGTVIIGRIGEDLDQQQGYDAARQTGLAILSSLKSHLGSLDNISKIIKLLGFVNCKNDFTQHPAVINGCSDLFAEVFGPENGVGIRSAVGTNSLPGNIPVEIECIFELKNTI